MQPLQDLFDHVVRQHFADGRTTFAQLTLADADGHAQLSGTVLDHDAAASLLADLRVHAPEVHWQDATTTLVNGSQYDWATVIHAAVDVRRRPSDSSDRQTQLVWGQRCEMLQREGNWAFVRAPDGYLGWTHAEPLHLADEQTAEAWRERCTHLVTMSLTPLF